jgi:hypothetical protein
MGQMVSRADEERGVQGFICSRWAWSRVPSSEMIGGVWAVRWGRRCGLSSVVWMRSSGACCANGQTHRFSRRARFSCQGRNDQVAERAGRGWRVARALMPCRFTCGARGKGACTFQNGDAALGVQSMHERGQCAGWRVANGRRGRQPSIGCRR